MGGQPRLWSQVAYVGMTLLQVLVAVIPGEPLEISGGYAFGAVQGTVLCMLGLFWAAWRYSLCAAVWPGAGGDFFPKEKIESLRFLQSSPKRDLLFWIVFVVPGTPKDLLCYFAGLTDLSWGKWLLICSLGRVPPSLPPPWAETLWVEKTTFLPFWCLPERWQSAP